MAYRSPMLGSTGAVVATPYLMTELQKLLPVSAAMDWPSLNASSWRVSFFIERMIGGNGWLALLNVH